MSLILCPACTRHVRRTESACPFCDAPVPAALAHSPERLLPTERLGRSAIFAFATLGAVACAGTATDGSDSGVVAASGGSGGAMSAGTGGARAGGGGGTGGFVYHGTGGATYGAAGVPLRDAGGALHDAGRIPQDHAPVDGGEPADATPAPDAGTAARDAGVRD